MAVHSWLVDAYGLCMMNMATQSVAKTQVSAPADAAPLEVEIHARDGVVLGGRYFKAASFHGAPPIATVVIHAATMVPARFYTSFATYLAGEGFSVLIYDYRGVGLSRRGSLKDLDADVVTWGEQDMNAAFAWLYDEEPNVPHFVVGHSVGGHFHGLMEHPERIDGIFTFGSGYGALAGIRAPHKYWVAFLWYLVQPALLAMFGYLPAKRLGLGEDIPAAAARQWARWGKRADYFHSELAGLDGFRQVDAPWLAWRASDDTITTEANMSGLHGCYPNVSVEERVIVPSEVGKESIGHLAFFRRSSADLWPEVAAWFAEKARSAQA